MNEIRTTTKVKEIVMSYQSFLRATSNPAPSASMRETSSPSSSIHRKPTATYSSIPETSPSAYRSVTQPSTRTPSLSTSSVTPGIPAGYAASTPASTTSQPAPIHPPTHTTTAVPAHTTAGAATTTTNSLSPLTQPQIDAALKSCLDLLTDATTNHSKRPFSALLLSPNNTTILQTHFSVSHVQHAESELARLASIQYAQPYLSHCTLVSTWEPCAMCAGTIYWSGIGRLLYAASETKLKDLTGSNNEENMTMDLPCRKVFDAGQRSTEVIGPVAVWEEKVVQESGRWWRDHKSGGDGDGSGVSMRSFGHNGGGASSSAASASNSVVVVQNEEPVLSSIGEDGEYQADLKVDWMM